MEYLLKKELIIKKEFLNRGYIIKKIKNKKSLNFIKKLIIKKIEKQILIKKELTHYSLICLHYQF